MARKKKKRQSNNEYRQRIRQSAQMEEQEYSDRNFRVLPKQTDRTSYRSAQQTSRTEAASRKYTYAGSDNRGRRTASGSVNAQRRTTRPDQAKKTNSNRYRNGASVDERYVQQSRNKKKARVEASGTAGRTSRASAASGHRKTASASKTRGVFFDYTLVFIVLFLVMFGLLMIFTASIYDTHYFIKQLVIAIGSVGVMFICAFFDYHHFEDKRWIIAVMILAVITVVMVKIPGLSMNLNGASRWVKIGPISFQPAEIFKIAVILSNAWLITKLSKIMAKPRVLLLFSIIMVAEALLILLVTENLSSAIIIGAITVLMVFVAYPGYKLFIGAGIGFFGLAAAFVYYVLHFCDPVNGSFRFGRIFAWLAPEKLPDQSKVFQTTQALYSIGSGGFWGKGLGNGTQKMILPEAMNDMIFAIICEELGMVGAFLVLVMFAILLYRLMFIAKNAKDLFGGMIATGIFCHFMLQVVLNIAVVTNLLPSTGVTLPFISYGGTALVLLMAEVGLALNVSRQIDFGQAQLVRRRKRS